MAAKARDINVERAEVEEIIVANPLYLQVKEGQWKELTSEEMKQIDPGLIKAISVLKDKEAIEKFMDYENAKHGVIVIEMKE